MSLTPGTRLGPYEISAQIGVGGMGEVYRATDTNLKRSVAIKVLPESVAGDRERLARFQREAEVLAALNHPNIAHIHGLERSDGTTALVMELVEGPTLADRIAEGPLPVEEAIPIASQIAEALEAAHEQGIIHRDLKPANVKVRDDGTVKVLDFGLAKALGPESANAPAGPTSASMSPTITSPALTEMGLILGTAAYMSPEQAKGRAVDKRADIWAFGVVLYEMLTGRRLFEAEDVSETLAAILMRDVGTLSLPPAMPPRLRGLIRDCLVRDPKRRLRDIGDARRILDDVIAGTPDDALPPPPAAAPVVPRWRRVLPWAVGAVGVLVVGAAAWMLRPELPTRAVVQFSIPLPEGQSFTNTGRRLLAMSSDGASLVYVANRSLYLRRMSGLEPHLIPGSASSASGVTSPAISPDGQSVAFYDDHALKRLALVGGVPVTICPASFPYGLSWDASGIVFGQYGKGILRVSADGGVPQVIVAAGGNETLSNPQVLPGGQAVLFSAAKSATTRDTAQVQVQSLDGGARKTLVENASDGRYLPTGHLVYAVQGVLLVAPFDLGSLSVTGAPVPLVQGVARGLGAQYTYSQTGALAFEPGPVATASSAGTHDLVIVDRQGKTQRVGLPPGTYHSPRVSPDGRFVAFDAGDADTSQVWIYALSGGTAMRQLTFTGHNQDPIWSPDGKWLAFQSDRDGDQAIFRKRADGSAAAERLTKPESGAEHVPQAFSPDGQHLLYSVLRDGHWTLWTMDMKDKTATAFGDVSSAALVEAAFSPDGKWVAYQSNGESGTSEEQTFLQPFPATGAKYLVGDGGNPFWSPKGDQLILNWGPRMSKIVPVSTTPTVALGQPIDFPRSGLAGGDPAMTRRHEDSLPDGEHIVGVTPSGQATVNASSITVVLNWFDEVRQRVPTP